MPLVEALLHGKGAKMIPDSDDARGRAACPQQRPQLAGRYPVQVTAQGIDDRIHIEGRWMMDENRWMASGSRRGTDEVAAQVRLTDEGLIGEESFDTLPLCHEITRRGEMVRIHTHYERGARKEDLIPLSVSSTSRLLVPRNLH